MGVEAAAAEAAAEHHRVDTKLFRGMPEGLMYGVGKAGWHLDQEHQAAERHNGCDQRTKAEAQASILVPKKISLKVAE
jgi:hypothetical protein